MLPNTKNFFFLKKPCLFGGVPAATGCSWSDCVCGVCKNLEENAHTYLAPHAIKTDMKKSYVTYQPMGIVFAIMPWNFPFFQVFRFSAPGLMAGNACILKHAPVTTGCGLAIEKLFEEVGFPKNLFRTVIVNNETAADIIADPRIIGVTLTGSVRAGKSVAATAGAHLKKWENNGFSLFFGD